MQSKRFISFSGGVESTTMCVLYGEGATAIWVDTGAEHEVMYQRIDYVEKRLKALHKGNFNLVRLVGAKNVLGVPYNNLEDAVIAKKFMPSGTARYCTIDFKVKPIDEYLRQQGECELMIGFNSDEEGRTGNLEMEANVKYTYPLIEAGLSRMECEAILEEHDLHPKFPVYMLRGGCRMCFFKSRKEYRAMFHLNLREFEEVMDFEKRIQDRRKKFYSIMGNGESLEQLYDKCKSELFQGDASLYDDYKKQSIGCGAFCHR